MAKSPTTNKVPLIYAMEQHGIKVNHLNVGIDIDNYLLEIGTVLYPSFTIILNIMHNGFIGNPI